MTYWDGDHWIPDRAPQPKNRGVFRRGAGHASAALLESTLVALLVVGLMAGTAFAAKGGQAGNGGKTSTAQLSLVLLDGADGTANHGERVFFETDQTTTDRPFVGLRCYQGSTWVLDGYVGLFETYMFDPWVTLDSTYWVDGLDASCTARLFYFDRRGREKQLATLTFPARP